MIHVCRIGFVAKNLDKLPSLHYKPSHTDKRLEFTTIRRHRNADIETNNHQGANPRGIGERSLYREGLCASHRAGIKHYSYSWLCCWHAANFLAA